MTFEQLGRCKGLQELWGQHEGGQGQQWGQEEMTALGRKR